MKKILFGLMIISAMAISVVASAETYSEVISKVVGNPTYVYDSNSGHFSGVIYGDLIDFNNDGVNEMLLIYRDSKDDSYCFGNCEIYQYVNGSAVKVFEEKIGSYLGQTDIGYEIYLKDDGDIKYLMLNCYNEEYYDDKDYENLALFSGDGAGFNRTDYRGEVEPWWDTYEFNFTQCAKNGLEIPVADYLFETDTLRKNAKCLILDDGCDDEPKHNFYYPSKSKRDSFLKAVENEKPVGGKQIKVLVNGIELSFDQSPVIINDRTMVPLRKIFEALGAEVFWNENERSVTSTKGTTTIKATIDSEIMIVNGKAIALDSPPVIIGDRTLVPVRAIAEAFGTQVHWDAETNTVLLYK